MIIKNKDWNFGTLKSSPDDVLDFGIRKPEANEERVAPKERKEKNIFQRVRLYANEYNFEAIKSANNEYMQNNVMLKPFSEICKLGTRRSRKVEKK